MQVQPAFSDKALRKEDKNKSQNYAEEQGTAQHDTQQIVHLKKKDTSYL